MIESENVREEYWVLHLIKEIGEESGEELSSTLARVVAAALYADETSGIHVHWLTFLRNLEQHITEETK